MSKERIKIIKESGPLGFVFFTAWIGALIYFVQQSNGFSEFLIAVLQSIVWPAYVLYAVLEVLNI